jgi:hypothetical protein
MTEPKNALIKQYAYLFSLHHVDFHVTSEALREIAAMALRKNTGARGLRAILERVLMQAMFEMPDDPEVTAVVVDAQAVHTRMCVGLVGWLVWLGGCAGCGLSWVWFVLVWWWPKHSDGPPWIHFLFSMYQPHDDQPHVCMCVLTVTYFFTYIYVHTHTSHTGRSSCGSR